MQKRDGVLGGSLVALSLMACSTRGDETLAVSNSPFDQPTVGNAESGDEVPSGQGLSSISLGQLGDKEMRSAFIQVYQPKAPGSEEQLSLNYSAIFADGNALSLRLPYDGTPLIFDASSAPIGGHGLMYALNGDSDMFSTRGTFRVEQTERGLAVRISDLVLSNPIGTRNSTLIGEGVIEGVVERRCFLAEPNPDGLTGPDGPVFGFKPDLTWSSEFCAQYL